MEILKLKQFESLGIQIISPKRILIQERKFNLGPMFAKHCTSAVLDFCRIVQANTIVVEHEFYFCTWLHYPTPSKPSPSPKKTVISQARKAIANPISSPNQPLQPLQAIEPEFIQCCQTTLIDLIGPIGKILLQKILNTPQADTPLTFIEALSQAIPDPEKARQFRAQFIPEAPNETNDNNASTLMQ